MTPFLSSEDIKRIVRVMKHKGFYRLLIIFELYDGNSVELSMPVLCTYLSANIKGVSNFLESIKEVDSTDCSIESFLSKNKELTVKIKFGQSLHKVWTKFGQSLDKVYTKFDQKLPEKVIEKEAIETDGFKILKTTEFACSTIDELKKLVGDKKVRKWKTIYKDHSKLKSEIEKALIASPKYKDKRSRRGWGQYIDNWLSKSCEKGPMKYQLFSERQKKAEDDAMNAFIERWPNGKQN